jgi:uncharacterized membrane protein YeiH
MPGKEFARCTLGVSLRGGRPGAKLPVHTEYHIVTPPSNRLLFVLDLAGTAVFAIEGATRGMVAVLLGTITGVGGGTLRDMLLAQVPAVLRVDVYATAAMAGAVVLVVGIRLRLPAPVAALLGAAACFALRMIAVVEHWNLPRLTV